MGRVHGPNQIDLQTGQRRRRRIGLVQPGRILKAVARDGALLVAHPRRRHHGVETPRGRQPNGLLEEANLGRPVRDVDLDEEVVVMIGISIILARRGGGGRCLLLLAQLGDQRGALVGVDVAHDDVGAVRGPPPREAGAEAGGAAGDEDGFAGEGGGVEGGGGVHGAGLVHRRDDAILVGRCEGRHFFSSSFFLGGGGAYIPLLFSWWLFLLDLL